jgi:hypothetical protein
VKTLVCLLFSLAVCACAPGETRLPYGYEYIRVDGKNAEITLNSRVIVEPNVETYQVIDDYIVGKRSNAKLSDFFSKHYGYFILNMRSGFFLEGMQRDKFDSVLRIHHMKSNIS